MSKYRKRKKHKNKYSSRRKAEEARLKAARLAEAAGAAEDLKAAGAGIAVLAGGADLAAGADPAAGVDLVEEVQKPAPEPAKETAAAKEQDAPVRSKAARRAGLLLAAAAAAVIAFFGIRTVFSTAAYMAGTSNVVPVYTDQTAEDTAEDTAENTDAAGSGEEEPAGMTEAACLVRGSAVRKYLKRTVRDGVAYRLIKTEDPEGNTVEYYAREEDLADSRDDCVLEKEVFARTPATIYENETGADIASFAPKGTCLKVIGHDVLLDNGYINKYKVEYEEDGKKGEGYVYGKYMTGTEEAALAVYNEHGEYDKAKKDVFGFELYGGKAKNLDYFPYEKTEIEGNEFCTYARAMYINTYAAVHPEPYVKLIKETDCNAVVIDIKDGPLTYKSPVAKEYSPTSYKKAYASMDEMRKGVDAYREAGVYLIGRIVVFNDSRFAKDNPEDCIKYGGKKGWPSAYSRDVWEYNVKLAKEAVEEFGFNEIQFDYVRFPESSYDMSKSGKADFRNKYGEEKAQAIQNFCFYAADQLRESGAYISVDVFGESAYSYVTAYGQYWAAISNIVDAISAMPYTDHFSADKAWEVPYKSVKNWAKRAAGKQKRLSDPAVARTWITGYDTPYWGPYVNYDAGKLNDQIRALEDSGLNGGFIPWNVLSDMDKYRQYKSIWNEK